jgi:Uncharacterised protein family (UPF0175)
VTGIAVKTQVGLLNLRGGAPGRIGAQFIGAGQEPARAALEALALKGYRSDRLNEVDFRELPGFDTRMEVHGFLKQQGAFLPYTDEDLEHDCEVPSQLDLQAERNVLAIRLVSGLPDDSNCRRAGQLPYSDCRD